MSGIADPYKNAVYDRRYMGTVLIDGRDSACTMRCVHCGGHWMPVKGSGVKRGFCTRCMGHACGPKCPALRYGTCVPHDVYLLFLEGKVGSIPIIGAVEAAPPVDARKEPRPLADQLRWHEPPQNTLDAFAADSDVDAPEEKGSAPGVVPG